MRLIDRGIAHEFFRVDLRRWARDAANVGAGVALTRPQVLVTPDGRAVLAVVGADENVDLASVRAATGLHDVRIAPPPVAARTTGFPSEWIPPVTLDDDLVWILDEALAHEDVLYGAGGEPGTLIGIRTEDLITAGVIVAPLTTQIPSAV